MIGLEGVDTRTLVKHIRTEGAMKGILSTLDLDDESLVAKAKASPYRAEGVSGRSTTLWDRIKVLVAALRDGEESWLVPAYNGALFAAAGIPTVYHGPVGSGAHADVEYMPVAELVRAANVYVSLLGRLLT